MDKKPQDNKSPQPTSQQVVAHMFRMLFLFYMMSVGMAFIIDGWMMMLFQIYMFWGISTLDKGLRRMGTSMVMVAQTTMQVAQMLIMVLFWPVLDGILAQKLAAKNQPDVSPRD